jgi:uncharacterized protein (DUF2249 family)
MEQNRLTEQTQVVTLVAREVVEEPDAIERHPEIFDVLAELASGDNMDGLFGGNGHDPAAFVAALAEGLAPYRTELLDDAPELVEGLGILAAELARVSKQQTAVPAPG